MTDHQNDDKTNAHERVVSNTSPQSCGFVAIIGPPNAGKSTLVNALVGQKVSIVTQKVQTTRFPVRGIGIENTAQMIFVDTPGIFSPKKRLERAMVASAHAQIQDADTIVIVLDAQSEQRVEFPEENERPSGGDLKSVDDRKSILITLAQEGKKAILVLNKIDGMRHEQLLKLSSHLFDSGLFSDLFMISAKNSSGVNDLKHHLASLMPDGPWHYPEDQVADAPVRMMAAEITREKLYLRVHEELPYSASVLTTKFEVKHDGSVRIEQDIFVERISQRAIIIGKNGQTLKWIGQKSREDIASILDQPVHLFLNVVVKENWSDDRAHYAQLGLDFNA